MSIDIMISSNLIKYIQKLLLLLCLLNFESIYPIQIISNKNVVKIGPHLTGSYNLYRLQYTPFILLPLLVA